MDDTHKTTHTSSYKPFRPIEWSDMDFMSQSIKNICTDILYTEQPYWSKKYFDNQLLPVNQLVPCKGYYCKPYRHRRTHSFIINGTPNFLLLPSLLTISFKTTTIDDDIQDIPTTPCSVTGSWSLGTQFASTIRYKPMLNAKRIFTIEDISIKKELEQHTNKSERAIIENSLTTNTIYRQFLFILGNLFNDCFITKEKYTTPIIPAYAEEIYTYLKQLFHIHITPIDKLDNIYRPAIVVAKLPSSISADSGKRCISTDTTFEYDFINKRKANILYGWLAPMVIASAYHTAFQCAYEEIDVIITNINETMHIDDTEPVTQEW